ncbi:portal protein [Escherichia phage SP15]|jgi:HK97 family phage portal protein|uniref:Portal protein n=5 Tax=Tequintavirus TaxID=187218 RepID=A0A494WE39_9CAUD|nr:portal protein [Escherichia phage vB_EcoS_FFH_1]YP_009791018.1 portal protein [Escherichia phage OSYSP]YP_009829800.1 portal protein [Escherichia phage SP15]YP_009843470.1 portal protein [Escherichia phage vB_EcoS_HdH2]YP_009849681.1 portal protein [Salmonella phage VSe12]AHN83581.1 portal protein [Escherichia phage vB_EcoS_FFH_1]ASM62955.1 portal protein [Escherichia phage OSYSP]QBQ81249.1 putative portal protein [Escherichia phage vB_EcoS_HdH2]QEA09968.1 portal protein [Salmonella phag
MGLKSWITEKLNPGQRIIRDMEPVSHRTNRKPFTTGQAYSKIEILNRTANMVIDSAAECSYTVGDKYNIVTYANGVKTKTLDTLLNVRPNPFMDISTFRRLVVTDLLFEGCAYIYWDGTSLYHVPAALMQVEADANKFIKKFIFNNQIDYRVDEIIFIKDNSYVCGTNSQISGQSRVATVIDSLEKRSKMLNFKEKFLDNGTVIGLILETDEILNKKLRERKQEELQLDYNPSTGQSSVLILDGGMKAKPYSQISSFKDLDFKEDIEGFNKSICLAFGVPQVLLDGGNNANIRPNIELFYYMTIIPMLNKLTSSLTFFFGYKITPNTKEVAALTPDKEAEAKHLTSLVNNGIMTGNEARLELNLEPLDDEQMDRIRIPANVAGSATGVSGQEGGRPQGSTEGDKE